MPELKLVVFDLGETLFRYEGIGLDWAEQSLRAWTRSFETLGIDADRSAVEAAEQVLETYNTRSTPRLREYASAHIFGDALRAAGIDDGDAEAVANEYFDFFRSNIKAYPEVHDALSQLRAAGVRLAALTDVAYGMSRALVEEDLRRVNLLDCLDHWLTSVDAGYRKPHSAGYEKVLALFDLGADQAVYVGNEHKDVVGATAADMRSILIDRDERAPQWGQSYTVRCLSELPALIESQWRDRAVTQSGFR